MGETIDTIMTKFRRDLSRRGLAPNPDTRMAREARRGIIIKAARQIADEYGAEAVTVANTARACSIPTSVSLVKHYFKNAEGLRRVVSASRKALSIAQVAQRTGLSRHSVRRAIEGKQLPAFKFGAKLFVSSAALRHFISTRDQ